MFKLILKDTVTGFLLAGIGDSKNPEGPNYLAVDSSNEL